MSTFQSWGGYPQAKPQLVRQVNWGHERIEFDSWDLPVLPYGYGRSYGDSCLNEGGIILATKGLQRFIAFDDQQGILRCEAGVTLADILEVVVPRGWFLPVTPGTKNVSIAGAIANDVHGKNHHRSGTFGSHVIAFELLRSTGNRINCSLTQNTDLFRATIGGLGLTGVIICAEIKLKPIKSPLMVMERIRFASLEEFFALAAESDEAFDYTAAWIDCLTGRRTLGRGAFIRGNHFDTGNHPSSPMAKRKIYTVPCNVPNFFLNSWTMKTFNSLYYHLQPQKPHQTLEHYEVFFYPLDSLQNWNRLYGSRGFLQYQCVIPPEHENEGIKDLLRIIQRAKQGSFLAILKKFGNLPSPGMLSFPRPGTTLALDFPFLGERTLSLLNQLDKIVRETGGAVYPAKDARMASKDFQAYFPKWEKFIQYKDPKFSSSFWRRVMAKAPADRPDSQKVRPGYREEILAGK